MNYVWDLIIKAGQTGIPKKNIKFTVAESYSPYMELSHESINFSKIDQEVEINPYYRFYEIFKDMFNINHVDDVEFRNTLFDIAVHFLTEIDIRQGMSKKEYYIKFILKELGDGVLGPKVKESLEILNEEDKNILAENILRLFITGEMLYLLKDTVRRIFKKSKIYANYETMDELLFFIDYKRTEVNEAKFQLIKDIFLPIRFRTEVYWEDHFGIIGVEETMMVDSIALY
ncbi:MAG: iron-dependent peroxidase [Clostridia bacterium]|nr:iron-dependent peroxidase [Clostridia bacterium]